ncbi:MAG: hypothetical protein A2X46_09160 [Lentisphaerae bacterium GWF2_57_35]|nr:MAG: hypothetical protein A2X46_09160 [Lentisphaerae bacterium GWF2_57_35]
MRFSVGMIVFNAELFLEACLEAIYDFAHQILIVEGSVPQARWDADPSGRSRDRTLEILRAFPDPQHKIKLVASQAWNHKDDMVNACLPEVTGDYLMHLDADEIWTSEALSRLREELQKDPSITCVEFAPHHFWHRFETVLVDGHWDAPFMRVFKFEPGARWKSHEPPVLLNPQGQAYNDIRRVNGAREWGITFHHYNYLTEEQARWKNEFFKRYYRMENVPSSDESRRIGMTRDWFEKVWLAWKSDPRGVEAKYGTTPGGGPAWRPVGRTAPYAGEHPAPIQKHPLFLNPAYHSSRPVRPACLEFKPAAGNSKRALVSYITSPFFLPPDYHLEFSNPGIARGMVRVLLAMGYEVDVVEYTNTAFRSDKTYDLFIGHGGINWEHLSRNVIRDAIRIYFSTGLYWKAFNEAEAERFADLERRRGIKLPYDRWIQHSEDFACEDADGIVTLGNQWVADSYRRFPCCLHLNNGVYADDRFDPLRKDFEAGRKRFLFFSGLGNVHKGLDRLIEAFAALDAELYCCTGFDPAFLKAYQADLAAHPNIRLMGLVQPRTEAFYKLMDSCNCLIFPSCAEGSPGSVAVGMNQGLIPIVSQASGIDTKDFGITLKTASPQEIAETVRWVMAQPADWHAEHAARTRQEALEQYSEERFLVNFHAAVEVIVKNAPRLRAAKKRVALPAKTKKRLAIDGVVFQTQARRPVGISRVWKNLTPELAKQLPDYEIVWLQRQGFPSGLSGIQTVDIPPYQLSSEAALEADDALLAKVCGELQADVFMSTYYTRAPGVRNVQTIYDMIPELFRYNPNHPEFISKRRAIANAESFVCISHSTRNDLIRLDSISADRCTVAPCGVSEAFKPADPEAVAAFREKYGLHQPYLVLAGSRGFYKNSVPFFQALASMPERLQWQVFAFGSEKEFWPEELPFAKQCNVVSAPWLPDEDLAAAYSGAWALVYPSRYEGFGLPVAEAMACGCPVITTSRASLPEVGGEAALYIDPDSAPHIAQALRALAAPDLRERLRAKGLQQAARFTWRFMAEKMAAAVRRRPQGDRPLVTAIVSTYKAERFMRGCLEDLEAQTIADRLEIIVIDSASPENEKAIVEEFQQRYSNIRYERTAERETVYAAWNRAVKLARGKYLTNANTDDRHAPEALEKMVRALEAHPEAGVAYADTALTNRENDTLAGKVVAQPSVQQNPSRELLFRGCFVGSQPLWRKSLHDRFGFFDADMVSAGDYEFWLRISNDTGFLHLPEVLGLYLESPTSVEHSNLGTAKWEQEQARVRYWQPQWGGRPIREERFLIRQRPLVSVVIVTQNRPRELRRALQSLLQQTYPFFEAIIVNNGGRNIDPVVSSFRSSLRPPAACTYLQHPGAQGIEAVRGEVMAYLDDTALWRPEHLEMLVMALQPPSASRAYARSPLQKESQAFLPRQLMHRAGKIDGETVLLPITTSSTQGS